VSGPTTIPPPVGVDLVRVRSAREMHDAIVSRMPGVDLVVMAAAVADYAPARVSEKIAKDGDELVLRMTRTPDILAELGARRAAGEWPRTMLVGFAAETSDLAARARDKRRLKQVDLMVANDVSGDDRGFDTEENAVTLVAAEGEEEVTLRPKADVARAILDKVERMLPAVGGARRPASGDGE
jgi:phosphopantothenoylcysteine decarboxylase/phosphopantothenate--cysteine ligase